ncbi:hypothetical protein SteCoe_35149 [Stentor coeruleus]|uniref:Uncharacterized protein n=1 Tax=Stentor coeruleus TaxID=5963 RepID=A0A1R2ASY1_9CILI|nr:hypothetical protein SteCoe_35149 [Stentor coeruleus]
MSIPGNQYENKVVEPDDIILEVSEIPGNNNPISVQSAGKFESNPYYPPQRNSVFRPSPSFPMIPHFTRTLEDHSNKYDEPTFNQNPYMDMPSNKQENHGIQISDSDHGNEKIFEPNETLKNDRRAFIRKVYALLSIQLIWTAIITGIVVGIPVIREGIKKTKGLVIAAMVICLALVIAIMCFKKIARRYPINYLALFTFSFFESYIVAYVCAFYDKYIVLCAALIALSVAFVLTIYAWKSKRDFTVCGGVLISVTTSLILFGFFMIFFNTHFLNLIFCEVAIIIYSVFIVYDTQLIAGGRYQEITFDDYVIGALILYVDIVGIFLYILSLFGSKS